MPIVGTYYYRNPATTFAPQEYPPSPQLERLLSGKPHLELTGTVSLEGTFPVYSGGHSECWKATWNGRPVRAKLLRFIGHTSEVEKCAAFEASVIKGIEEWDTLRHPNILPFLGCTRGFGTTLTLISPWIPTGCASDYLKEHPSADRPRMVADIADGLVYLHSRGVIHGDLRGSNILISLSASRPVPMISDTGLGIAMGLHTSMDHAHNAERWVAIQAVVPGNTDSESPDTLTYECDIWSLGMLVYELFTDVAPYDNIQSVLRLMWVIRRGTLPEYPGSPAAERGLSREFWDIVQSCWGAERSRRPSAADVARKMRGLISHTGGRT